MTTAEGLDKLLQSFSTYYNISREGVSAPFDAVAEFHSRDEQFFLVKSAKMAEEEANEYVYFASTEKLDEESLRSLDEKAWTQGLSCVKPHSSHRSTDVTLIVLADRVEQHAMQLVRKMHHYKSYRLGFQGWSNYRLVAVDLSSGQVAYNRQGQVLRKFISNIFSQK